MSKPVPFDIDAEKATLGAVILRNDLWHEAASVLGKDDFYRSAHSTIWESMGRLMESGSAVDALTLKVALGDQLDEVGGFVYLASLVDGVPTSVNLAHYARIVREKSTLRKLIAVCVKLSASAYASEPSSEIIETAVTNLLKHVIPDDLGAIELGQGVMSFIERLDDKSVDDIVPTGFVTIDAMMSGGMRTKDLVIVAARPSVGKSSMGMSIAHSVSKRGIAVSYFSMEMRKEQLVSRLISWEAKIPSQRIATHRLLPDDYGRLAHSVETTREQPLTIVDNVYTLAQISAWCHRLKQKHGASFKLAVVDYLQMLLSDEKQESREKEVAALSRGLKRLAKDINIVVLALSQLSRAPEGRKDKRPVLSDLRESGALEQDADVAMLLFREDMHGETEENRGIAEVIMGKQREGPTGVQRLYFAKDYAWFTDLAIG